MVDVAQPLSASPKDWVKVQDPGLLIGDAIYGWAPFIAAGHACDAWCRLLQSEQWCRPHNKVVLL